MMQAETFTYADKDIPPQPPTFGELQDMAGKLAHYYDLAQDFFRGLDELEDLTSIQDKQREEVEYEKELKGKVTQLFADMAKSMQDMPCQASVKVQTALIKQTMQMFNMALEALKNA